MNQLNYRRFTIPSFRSILGAVRQKIGVMAARLTAGSFQGLTPVLVKTARHPALLLLSLFWAVNVVAAELQAQAPKSMPAIHNAALKALLAQSKNSPVILAFWASWCEPCREEMPALQQLAERWHQRGLKVITIAVADSPEKSREFMKKVSAVLPLIDDPDQLIAQSWGVYLLPVTIVLNRQHRIVASSRGAIEWDTAPVEKQLQSLLQRR